MQAAWLRGIPALVIIPRELDIWTAKSGGNHGAGTGLILLLLFWNTLKLDRTIMLFFPTYWVDIALVLNIFNILHVSLRDPPLIWWMWLRYHS